MSAKRISDRAAGVTTGKSGIRWSNAPIFVSMPDGRYPGIEGRRDGQRLAIYRDHAGKCWTGSGAGFTLAEVTEGFNLLCKRLAGVSLPGDTSGERPHP